jgi:chromosome segregation ATPase
MSEPVELWRNRFATWTKYVEELQAENAKLRRDDSEYEALCDDLKKAEAEVARLRDELKRVNEFWQGQRFVVDRLKAENARLLSCIK